MNKIFKTLWNAERHQQVVVNEATSSAQSRGTAKHQTATVAAVVNNRTTGTKSFVKAQQPLASGYSGFGLSSLFKVSSATAAVAASFLIASPSLNAATMDSSQFSGSYSGDSLTLVAADSTSNFGSVETYNYKQWENAPKFNNNEAMNVYSDSDMGYTPKTSFDEAMAIIKKNVSGGFEAEKKFVEDNIDNWSGPLYCLDYLAEVGLTTYYMPKGRVTAIREAMDDVNFNDKITLSSGDEIDVQKLELSEGTTTITGKYYYTGPSKTYDSESGDWFVRGTSSNINWELPNFIQLENNGGIVNADSLVFSSGSNAYIQNSGSATFQTYTGGGLIDMNGGTLALGTLSSGATLDADGGTIIAPVISLTDSTFSASNTELQTGLNQIADFQQVINQAQALLMASNDAKTSLNAKPLFC